MTEEIRVALVDDNDSVRMALALFIETSEHFHLIGEAASGQEAIELCARLRPDVVLMDLLMPDMDGIAATRAILQQNPDIQVIFLSSSMDNELAQEACQAGAAAYLAKNVSIDTLSQAILDAHHSYSLSS